MQNKFSKLFHNLIIVFLLLSSILHGEWLSEKNPSKFAPTIKKLTGNTNKHGFYKPKIKKDKFPKISILHSQKDSPTKIKLTWDPPTGDLSKVRYAIYTAPNPINSYEKFLNATRISYLNGRENKFLNAINKSGTFYYAVSVISNNTEYFVPEFDQSYTAGGISMNQKPIYTVKGITTTYDPLTKVIKIKWTLPPNSTQKYKIIRSERPILFPTDIDSARVLAETSLNTDEYSLAADKEGFFWYAVLSIAQDNRLSRKLILSENVTRNELAIKLSEEKIELVKNLKAIYNPTNNSIEINWSPLKSNSSAVKLFQSKQESISSKPILLNSTLLKTFLPNSQQTNFTINNPSVGNWFFAAITYNNSKVDYTLQPATNTLLYPVVIKSNATNLSNILAPTNKFDDGLGFQTNQIIIYRTNEFNFYQTNEITIIKTNIIEVLVAKTNFIDIPQFETNIIHITNQITITNEIQTTGTQKTITPNKRQSNITTISEDSTKQLRTVIRDFYKNTATNYVSGFNNNITELLKIRANTTAPAIKAQCTLFIGRAYFRLKKYNIAIKYFINIQNSLPDESNIWIRRCIRYMR